MSMRSTRALRREGRGRQREGHFVLHGLRRARRRGGRCRDHTL